MDPASREEPEVTSRPRGEFALQQSGGKQKVVHMRREEKGEERGLRREGRG